MIQQMSPSQPPRPATSTLLVSDLMRGVSNVTYCVIEVLMTVWCCQLRVTRCVQMRGAACSPPWSIMDGCWCRPSLCLLTPYCCRSAFADTCCPPVLMCRVRYTICQFWCGDALDRFCCTCRDLQLLSTFSMYQRLLSTLCTPQGFLFTTNRHMLVSQ